MCWQLLDGPVIEADCVDAMRALPAASIDAIVTDPPYGLEFMGKDWDRLGGDTRQIGDDTFKQGDARHGSVRYGGASYGQDAAAAGRAMQEWHEAWAREALRVLKPGGHLLAFGGTRTYHRLACAVEDAGFEIRDSLMWVYGSGFPKSMNVSLAIDKAARGTPQGSAGPESPHHVMRGRAIPVASTHLPSGKHAEGGEKLTSNPVPPYEPQTEDAARWDGWGTALKPAHEPIVVARKPLAGTVAGNVLAHGTGALNVDGCRIDASGGRPAREVAALRDDVDYRPNSLAGRVDGTLQSSKAVGSTTEGRWPANVVLSHAEGCVCVGERRVATGTAVQRNRDGGVHNEVYGEYRKPAADDQTFADGGGLETVEAWECVEGCPVAELDRQSGDAGGAGRASGPTLSGIGSAGIYNPATGEQGDVPFYGDSGGASRFFYVAKASRAEREAGVGGEPQPAPTLEGGDTGGVPQSAQPPRRNVHPTVKPVGLMRWLVRLVTPPDGIVLDPFCGSGTTGCAAALEGFDFIGVERDPDYAAIARERIGWWAAHPAGVETERVFAAEKKRAEATAAGQDGLF